MKRISNFFYDKSSWVISILAIVVVFGYLVIIMIPQSAFFKLENAQIASLGTSFGFSFEHVVTFFSERTRSMNNSYLNFNLIWDNIFALLYGLMYILLLSSLYKPFKRKIGMLNLFPIFQSLFDVIENSNLALLSNSHLESMELSNIQVSIASTACMAKWICSTIIFLILIVGIFFRNLHRFKRSTIS